MKIINLSLLSFFLTISIGYGQNLIPFNWTLHLKNSEKQIESIPYNMLFSWQTQGISDLKPEGELKTSFFINQQKPENFNLEVTLLADIKSILINGNYIGGNFKTHFRWKKIKYEPKKFIVPAKFLKFDDNNTISIICSNYSYTGGKNFNKVKLFKQTNEEQKLFINLKPENHLFEKSDKVKFNIITDQNTLEGTIEVVIKNDFHDIVYSEKIILDKLKHSYLINLEKKHLEPGFYKISAILKSNQYVGETSFFTIAPTKIVKNSKPPKGYDEYWIKAKKELKSIKPNFKIEKRNDLSSEVRNGFVIQMQTLNNKTIYGYYFTPNKKGKFPTILHLPGYGEDFNYLKAFINNKDNVIEMALCVSGHGLSKEALKTEFPVPGFFGYNICDIDKIAYRQIYMDCLRAIDFLMSRKEVDKSKIGVMGTSQGGGLALMTASLANENISACAYGDPFPTDMKNHIRIRTLIKDELNSYLNYYNNKCNFKEGLRAFDFFDTKYFAKEIKAKTLYITGLEDDDCPPRLGFSAYNEINTNKEFLIFPTDSHRAESNWKKEMIKFFKKEFKY